MSKISSLVLKNRSWPSVPMRKVMGVPKRLTVKISPHLPAARCRNSRGPVANCHTEPRNGRYGHSRYMGGRPLRAKSAPLRKFSTTSATTAPASTTVTETMAVVKWLKVA